MRHFVVIAVAVGLVACGSDPSRRRHDDGNGGGPSSTSVAQGGGAEGGGGAQGGGGSEPMCSVTVLDCDGEPGCETDILEDPANCGACGMICDPVENAVPVCIAGSCTFECVPGLEDCNGIVGDGCETDPLTSVWNCGACANFCLQQPNSTPSCVAGNCVHTCDTGFDDCNGDPADGCEVQLVYDPGHCGTCGNVCPAENGTAQCTLGHCSVELVIAGSNVVDIAVSGGFVYFANGNEVRRVATGGGSSQLLGAGGAGTVTAITLSGSAVYFLHAGQGNPSLLSVPESGGSATAVAALPPDNLWNVRELAADTTHAYWIDDYDLTSVPLSGGPLTTWGGSSSKGGPVVGGGAVYFTGGSNFGDVFGMPQGGGTVTMLLDAFGPYDTIAVDAGFAYVPAASTLERVPLLGGPAQLLASNLDTTYYVATDGIHVYLYTRVSQNEGEIVRVPIAGGMPEALAAFWNPSLNYGGIAVDATHVYWATTDRIRKMPK